MPYRLLADAVVFLHVAFAAFVALGGLLALRWRRAAWLHAPCLLWGATVELAGWVCPLTPLENWLRAEAGESIYAGDFVGRYLLAVLYPGNLTRSAQLSLGLLVLAINAAVYSLALHRARKSGGA
jgi:hypothetical protein